MKKKEELVVLVDDRERKPWSFSDRVRVERRRLASGDYSVEGLEDSVAVERKSLDDLVSTLFHGRARFFAELERLRSFAVSAVIVEATPADIELHRFTGEATPAAIFASTAAIQVYFGVPVVFAGNRGGAARWAEELLWQGRERARKKSRRKTDKRVDAEGK